MTAPAVPPNVSADLATIANSLTVLAADVAQATDDCEQLEAAYAAEVSENATLTSELAAAGATNAKLAAQITAAGYALPDGVTITPKLVSPAAAPSPNPAPAPTPALVKPRLGVHDTIGWSTNVADIAPRIALLIAAHVKVLRTAIKWVNVEPSLGQYNFAFYVALAQQCQAAGIKLILTIEQFPQSANGMTNPYDAPAIGTAAWTTFLSRWGFLMAPMASALRGNVYAYEPGNEPNLGGSMFAQADPVRYAAMVSVMIPAIAVAVPTALVSIGGMDGANATPGQSGSMAGGTFLTGVYAHLGSVKPAAVSFHPYPSSSTSDPATPVTVGTDEFMDITLVRAIMKANGQATTPMMFTEFGGWNGNAAYFSKAVGLMPTIDPNITDACFFEFQDSTAYPSGNLLTTAGQPDNSTEMYSTFVSVAEGLGQ